MSYQDVNWWDKVADWSWTIVLGLVAAALSLIHRVFRHEARLAALEAARAETAAQALRVEKKIDDNHDKVLSSLDGIRNEISEERKEFNENYRLVLSQLLERVPKP